MGSKFAADGPSDREVLFVSHAHWDHLAGLKRRSSEKQIIVSSAATLDLASELLGFMPRNALALEPNRRFQVGDECLTIYPANHILGSAQALVETKQGSVGYTGDFKQPDTPVMQPDALVIEATYGAPMYQRQLGEAEVAFVEIVEKCLKNGPLTVYAYAAKVQEAMSLLNGFVDADFLLDKECHKMAQVYSRHGYRLPQFHQLGAAKDSDRSSGSNKVIFKTLGKSNEKCSGTKIILSGWSSSVVNTIRGGYMIRLSDHADFTQLLQYVEESRPRIVYTDGSRSSYAQVLAKAIEKRLGITARAAP
jgi:putative mRNA 3-end processing factor